MSADTRSEPLTSPLPGGPEPMIGPGHEQPPSTARARAAAAATQAGAETRGQRLRRKAHRARLNGYAIVTVAVVAVLIALAASNTAPIKVHWLIGTAHVSLVWLVLVGAVLGWVLGLLASARFRWRTRAPKSRG